MRELILSPTLLDSMGVTLRPIGLGRSWCSCYRNRLLTDYPSSSAWELQEVALLLCRWMAVYSRCGWARGLVF